MNKIRSWIFLIISLTIIGCSNDSDCIFTHRYLPQELKEYCDFPVGSYWIYKDSISGAIDSVHLFKKTRICTNETECNNCPTHSSESLEILVNEEFEDLLSSSYFADTFSSGGSAGTASGGGLASAGYRWGTFPFWGNEPTPSEYSPGANIYLNFYDEFIINSDIYHSLRVYLRHDSGLDTSGVLDINYKYVNFLAKNIGIVKCSIQNKKTLPQKFVWELIRYHINN